MEQPSKERITRAIASTRNAGWPHRGEIASWWWMGEDGKNHAEAEYVEITVRLAVPLRRDRQEALDLMKALVSEFDGGYGFTVRCDERPAEPKQIVETRFAGLVSEEV